MQRTRADTLPDCRPLLADPADLTVVFQPVVDLAGATVAGYEALSRFPGTAEPDVWVAAAAQLGVAAELDALALHTAWAAVPDLPADAFLLVRVDAGLLPSPVVRAGLAACPDPHRVVVELTGTTPIGPADLAGEVDALRRLGTRIATGRGRCEVHLLELLRPDLVRIDGGGDDPGGDSGARDGARADDALRTAVRESVVDAARAVGARLLLGGLEQVSDLLHLARLDDTLGQGWALAPPARDLRPLQPDAVALLRSTAARIRRRSGVGSLVPAARPLEVLGDDALPTVLLGPAGEPVALVVATDRPGAVRTAPVSLVVDASADPAHTLQRALARPPAQRMDPVVCTDPRGAVLGLLRMADLVSAATGRWPQPEAEPGSAP